jgi:hypothetical protein
MCRLILPREAKVVEGRTELVEGSAATPRELLTGFVAPLFKDLRVNGRSEILPVVTPAVCALPSSVEAAGIEPRKLSHALSARSEASAGEAFRFDEASRGRTGTADGRLDAGRVDAATFLASR